MNRRIALWALVGFFVAVLWAIYAGFTRTFPLSLGNPIWPLVELTCPIAAASLHLNFRVSLLGSLAANAATYALIAASIETLHKRLLHSH
jgi:hypothetical protein